MMKNIVNCVSLPVHVKLSNMYTTLNQLFFTNILRNFKICRKLPTALNYRTLFTIKYHQRKKTLVVIKKVDT